MSSLSLSVVVPVRLGDVNLPPSSAQTAVFPSRSPHPKGLRIMGQRHQQRASSRYFLTRAAADPTPVPAEDPTTPEGPVEAPPASTPPASPPPTPLPSGPSAQASTSYSSPSRSTKPSGSTSGAGPSSSRGVQGDRASAEVLDAFFLGRALAEVVLEKVGSAVGEFLSDISRAQAEQQQQIRQFQDEVQVRAAAAKDKATKQ